MAASLAPKNDLERLVVVGILLSLATALLAKSATNGKKEGAQ